MTKKMLAFIIALALVLILTLVANRYPNNAFLFYALFPGLYIHILITGGHGGTLTEERIGFATELITNLLVYSAAVLLLLRLRKSSN